MKKVETIKKLKEMQCDIAEVICDIACRGSVCYPNESILVLLQNQPSNDDLIKHGKHWTICDNIDDFKEGMVFGEKEAKEKYCKYYVTDFKEVKEFISDFPIKKTQK